MGFAIDSGIECSTEALQSYTDVVRGKHRYVTYKIRQGAQTNISIAQRGKPDATFEDLLNDLPVWEARYFIYDCRFVCDDDECQPRHRVIFVSWLPEDTTSTETKVTYASTRVSILKTFHHHDKFSNVEITDPLELTEELLLSRIGQPGENPLLYKEKKVWDNIIERPSHWPPIKVPEPEKSTEEEKGIGEGVKGELGEGESGEAGEQCGENLSTEGDLKEEQTGEGVEGRSSSPVQEIAPIEMEAVEEVKPMRDMSEVMSELRESSKGTILMDEVKVEPINIHVIVPEPEPVVEEPVEEPKKTLKEIMMQ